MGNSGKFYDELETRSEDERMAAMAASLPAIIAHAKNNTRAFAASLKDIDPAEITTPAALAALPVMRKSDMVPADPKEPGRIRDFTGCDFAGIHQVFQSPGPIYEPGMMAHDWWRFGRALHAAGIRSGDIIQNCFSYHFTPAGMMFESAARAVGATVFPAGTGQTELQATAMANLGVTAYAGTPDYLKSILDKGAELGLDMGAVKHAAVSGGPLFPQIREEYNARSITCLQCYGTAELGHIAYESAAMEGMIVDEGIIVEILRPGTGDPVAAGEIGEVVVTTLANRDFPMIRFATGDLSAVMEGTSPCGRTNTRIIGWRGRADQATKVKGMFVRPEQVAQLVARYDAIIKARVTVSHDGKTDLMHIRFESTQETIAGIEDAIRDILKLRASVEFCAPGSLPNDGKVIDDTRGTGN